MDNFSEKPNPNAGDQNQPNPPRTRFNFSNNRLTARPTEALPTNFYAASAEAEHRNTDRQARRALRQAAKATPKDGPMVFNVAQLMREHEGASREYEVDDPGSITLEEVEGTTARNIQGHIKLMRVGREILAAGHFEADAIVICVRCLNPYEEHVEFDIEDIYRPSIDMASGLPVEAEPELDEDKLLIDSNHMLNLGEAVRQQILVSVPMFPKCGRPDCVDIKAVLNRVNSDIPAAPEQDEDEDDNDGPVDPRWKGLSNLHFDE